MTFFAQYSRWFLLRYPRLYAVDFHLLFPFCAALCFADGIYSALPFDWLMTSGIIALAPSLAALIWWGRRLLSDRRFPPAPLADASDIRRARGALTAGLVAIGFAGYCWTLAFDVVDLPKMDELGWHICCAGLFALGALHGGKVLLLIRETREPALAVGWLAAFSSVIIMFALASLLKNTAWIALAAALFMILFLFLIRQAFRIVDYPGSFGISSAIGFWCAEFLLALIWGVVAVILPTIFSALVFIVLLTLCSLLGVDSAAVLAVLHVVCSAAGAAAACRLYAMMDCPSRNVPITSFEELTAAPKR